MKQKLLLLLLLSVLWAMAGQGGAHAASGDEESQLVLSMIDGNKIYFMLSERPKITFAEQTMKIGSASREKEIEIANVSQFYFSDKTNAINNLKANDIRVRFIADDKVMVEGVSAEKIRLYALDGKEIKSHVVYSDGSAIVSLSLLLPGVYILVTDNNHSLKIYRR